MHIEISIVRNIDIYMTYTYIENIYIYIYMYPDFYFEYTQYT